MIKGPTGPAAWGKWALGAFCVALLNNDVTIVTIVLDHNRKNTFLR